jgi:hypothetical protein
MPDSTPSAPQLDFSLPGFPFGSRHIHSIYPLRFLAAWLVGLNLTPLSPSASGARSGENTTNSMLHRRRTLCRTLCRTL